MSAETSTAWLVTGASGFLGRQVMDVFSLPGRELITVGRDPRQSVIHSDLATGAPNLGARHVERVFHLAGKAHVVPRTADEQAEFHRVNVAGTRHLLQALEQLPAPPQSFVLVSTVAVYGREEGSELDEDTPLAATDPYGQSKMEAEEAVNRWCAKHGVTCGIVRLPLIAGSNPPGNLGAMIRAMRKGYYVRLRNNPARRSIVRARDVAAILPAIAQRGGVYHLTDGEHPSIASLETALVKALGARSPVSLPQFPLKLAAAAGDVIAKTGLPFPLTSRRLRKLTSTLTFSDARARRDLDWRPASVMGHLNELIT